MQIFGCSYFYHLIAIVLYMPMYKIMKGVKKHIQNWKDIRIADIPKLYAIRRGKSIKIDHVS